MLALIVGTGALDDYRHIDPWVKFTVQFIAAIIIVVAGQARLFLLGMDIEPPITRPAV